MGSAKGILSFTDTFPNEESCIKYFEIYVGRMALFLLLIKLLRFINAKEINIVARTLENILM